MRRPSVYWLLVFVPISAVIALVARQPLVTFATSALAILPLAALIGRATEQLSIV